MYLLKASNMSSVITGLCPWMTGKGDQIVSVKLEEEDVDVLLEEDEDEDVREGVRRGRGASFRGFEAI
jgi:hypothetical protein